MNIKTPSKRELAHVLRAIADWIEKAANQKVTVNLHVVFEVEKDEA